MNNVIDAALNEEYKLTSSFKGNLAGLTGPQEDNALYPRAGGELRIWSKITADEEDIFSFTSHTHTDTTAHIGR